MPASRGGNQKSSGGSNVPGVQTKKGGSQATDRSKAKQTGSEMNKIRNAKLPKQLRGKDK